MFHLVLFFDHFCFMRTHIKTTALYAQIYCIGVYDVPTFNKTYKLWTQVWYESYITILLFQKFKIWLWSNSKWEICHLYIYIFRQGFRVGVVCMYYPLAKNVIYHILHFQYWILVMAAIPKPLGLHWVTSDLLTSAVLYLTSCPNISRPSCQTWTHAWYHVKINHLLARWWWCLPCTRQTCWDGNFIWAVLHIKVASSISMLRRVVLTFLQVFMIFDDTIGIVNQPLTELVSLARVIWTINNKYESPDLTMVTLLSCWHQYVW